MNSDFSSRAALITYLETFFLERPDLHNRLASLILTHPHIDHTRSVRDVLLRYRPRNVVTNGMTTGSGRYGQIAANNYVDAADATPTPDDDVGFRAVRVSDIPAGGLTDDVIDPVNCGSVDPDIRVLWGLVDGNTSLDAEALSNPNNNSVAVRVSIGGSSVLLTGDLEDQVIPLFLQKYAGTDVLDVDIYQVGHHGSANGTTLPLVQAMSPEYAVFSMGSPDREALWTAFAYGHPRLNIVRMLEAEVTGTREATQVQAALRPRRFRALSETHGLFATGWDSDLVFSADGHGGFAPPAQAGGPEPPALVNANTATVGELERLPNIGAVRAAAIVAYRLQHGPFVSLSDLDHVPGIGPATLSRLRDLVTFGQH